MFNKSNHNETLAKQAVVAFSLLGIVLTTTIAQASNAIVVKGTNCHPGSPVGLCCPNDGSSSGPYCPERRISL
ncbi:hypothetical protein B6N60_02680 [Richelia sinica FACHB-800]|uniref:Uncharacterized protein n=1 Tax=Richelia sinica FACHB-800 TaxID=1357546 RepID=A0A975T9L7_9NOST|nr:hypothetical protein [Richelia sinica]MBD2665912.1 hypothetical protein [Richelia sinica FACHB-800]QXE23978.1 hypothetical protein B6N60_02680 [Richelia sinica FACHB-800]